MLVDIMVRSVTFASIVIVNVNIYNKSHVHPLNQAISDMCLE